MTHDLLRQTSKPRIPPPIPVRVESRIRRSSTLLSLPSYIDFLSSVGSRLSPSSFPPSLASNDNVSFVWIRFDLRVYRVINIELILCSMLLGYIKYYSNSFFIYLGNWDWILSRLMTKRLRNLWRMGTGWIKGVPSLPIRVFLLGKFISKTINVKHSFTLESRNYYSR